MSIILLILIIGVLIFIHELGHFVVAKYFKVRVDEFGMGLPPRAVKLFSRDGTDYTLNWIPFGGFVKIYGEDALQESSEKDPDYERSFVAKKWWQQIAILIAGVTMNFLFAWMLFSLVFMTGAPTAVSSIENTDQIKNAQLTVLQVIKDSPAEQSGIVPGDIIREIESLNGITSGTLLTRDTFITQVQSMPDNTPLRILIASQTGEEKNLLIIPEKNNNVPFIGVSIDQVGIYREGFFTAIGNGFTHTIYVAKETTKAFGNLIADAFRGEADIDTLTGPVGLVSVVGDAQKVGVTQVIMLTALISVNLAVLNLFPFPALDGGRIVMVFIETMTRRKIKPSVVQWVNGIGFLLLIGLMIVITVKDVIKLF